jgi:hypothetical protein
MKRLLLIGVMLFLPAGCNKGTNTAPQSGNTGGPGGTVQQVRKAVTRSIDEQQMHQLHLLIEGSAAGERLPAAETIAAELQRDAPQISKLVQDKVIVLTGARSRQAIWAYTPEAQTTAGEHLVLTSSGVGRMTKEALDQRLQQEKGK